MDARGVCCLFTVNGISEQGSAKRYKTITAAYHRNLSNDEHDANR